MTRRRIRFAPLALALMVSACGSSPSTSPTTTTSGLTTENFTGTVAVGGTDSKTFSVAVTGVVSVTLTAAPVPMGLGVGQPGGASGCVLLPGGSTTATAGTLAQLAGEVTPGTFCVQVYDVSNQTVPVTYSVTVTHP